MQNGYYDHDRSEALDLLAEQPRHVLDIGCGRGGVTRNLKSRYPGVRSTGIDVYTDPDFDYATTFDSFAQIDLERDPLPASLDQYDLILLLDVLEHLREPDRLLRQLVEASREGCYFLVSLPNFHYYSNLFSIVRSGRFPYAESGILDRTHVRFFGFEDAREMLERELKILTTRRFNPFENGKSRWVGRIFGLRYSAFQNIFLCQKIARAL